MACVTPPNRKGATVINADDPTGIEDLATTLADVSTASDVCITDQVASLAQALGFVLEHARNRGLSAGVSAAELDELVDRYRRRGALIEQAIAAHEGKAHGN
jgi:hypothetical protein